MTQFHGPFQCVPCLEFSKLKTVLAHFFSKEEMDYLYEKNDYNIKYLTKKTLKKYFLNPEKIDKIIQKETPFFDHVKQCYSGFFDIEFADKLLDLMREHYLVKETSFNYGTPLEREQGISMGEYNLRFATDSEYADGISFFLGELCNNCESIGKSGGDLCLFDALAKSSRTFIIRRNDEIVGQAPVFINDEGDTLVIASLASTSRTNGAIVRCLLEEYCLSLLALNPKVELIAIGIGGRNFISIGGKKFTRTNDGRTTKAYEALGKIRHNPDISRYAKEVEICEKAIGLQFLPDYNPINNKEVQMFMTEITGAITDFLRLAVFASRKQLADLKKHVPLKRAKYLFRAAPLSGRIATTKLRKLH